MSTPGVNGSGHGQSEVAGPLCLWGRDLNLKGMEVDGPIVMRARPRQLRFLVFAGHFYREVRMGLFLQLCLCCSWLDGSVRISMVSEDV